MPIIPASQIKHGWFNRALAEYAEMRKQPGFGTVPTIHTVRCPGIFSLMRHGWVLRAWQDFVIETNGDLNRFTWRTPIDQAQLSKEGAYVQSHTREQLSIYMDSWPKNTMQCVIKIASGWSCDVPKDHYLLEMPVAYSGETRFTTLSGYFASEYGPAPLNPQLLWHETNGQVLVKAGTPLAQYILVPKSQYELEIGSDEETTSKALLSLVLSNRFVKNFNEIKNFFKNRQ